MAKKKKPSRNKNKNSNKRRHNNNTRTHGDTTPVPRNPPAAPVVAAVSAPHGVSSLPSMSKSFENLSVQDGSPNELNELMKSEVINRVEPGRRALIVDLKNRTELNGKPVLIKEILPNGRVAVEHVLPFEQKGMFSVKKENLLVTFNAPHHN